MNILVIEDDKTLNQNICEALQAESMHVTSLYDGALAEKILRRDTFDCIVMDVNLPGKNGFDLCRDFRQYNTTTPVILLTAFAELDDKIQGYNCGANDYLTKPFYIRELLLRINSLLQLTSKKTSVNTTITAADIVIDTKTKSVSRQGQLIALTPREYQILCKLIQHKGELISKKDLIQEIWGNIVDANTNTIEVYINFLRNKIDKPFGKQNIKTKVGYGYYFDL